MNSKKILIAVAWPYVNGDLHPGHLAGYLLPADIFARFQRICGNDVLMVSGSDCHGTPITIQADKEGVNPIEIVNRYHKRDVEIFRKYKLSYNLYTHTRTKNHAEIVQTMFLDLLNNGYIEKDTMKQYYSDAEKKFLPDRYVEGKCPFCGADNQRSDQCEICGKWIPDGALINPKSKLSGSPVELKDTEHYFLMLNKFEKELREYVNSKANVWREWVYRESIGWLDDGLKPRSITRDMDWAIDLPIDQIKLNTEKSLSSFEGKKIYVWFEAVIGYLSASIEWSKIRKNEIELNEETDKIFYEQDEQSTEWQEWWLNTESEHYYFMGQDNLVFHTLMWPAQLIGTQRGYTLPHNVVVNKFLNYEGEKFSKSRGKIIDLNKLLESYQLDTIRFYISSILPENKEGDFKWEEFKNRVNGDLVGNLGNFINRTLTFALKSKNKINLDFSDLEIDTIVLQELTKCFDLTYEYLNQCRFVDALKAILDLTKFGNKYFDDSKIWSLEDSNLLKKYLFSLLNIVSNLIVLISPFLPDSSENLKNMTGITKQIYEIDKNNWSLVINKNFENIGSVHPLFKKIEDLVIV